MKCLSQIILAKLHKSIYSACYFDIKEEIFFFKNKFFHFDKKN